MKSPEHLFEAVEERFYVAPFVGCLGLRLTRAEPGIAEVRVETLPAHRQQDGFVHAGVIATLADHAGGAAGWTKVKDAETVLSVEFKISFFRPAKGPSLLCEARVIRAGKRLVFTEAEVFDTDGKLVSKLSQTLAIVPRNLSAGE